MALLKPGFKWVNLSWTESATGKVRKYRRQVPVGVVKRGRKAVARVGRPPKYAGAPFTVHTFFSSKLGRQVTYKRYAKPGAARKTGKRGRPRIHRRYGKARVAEKVGKRDGIGSGTSSKAEEILLSTDAHYHRPTDDERHKIHRHFNIPLRSFDLVWRQNDRSPLASWQIVEVKSSKKFSSLKGYFFGITENQKDAAKRLGNYRFCFMMLKAKKPKPILKTLNEVLNETKFRGKVFHYTFKE